MTGTKPDGGDSCAGLLPRRILKGPAEHIVFRAPFAQSPIPGRPADAGGADFRAFFAVTAGLVAQGASTSLNSAEVGETIEFGVMIRPITALSAEIGNRIGPQLARLKRGTGRALARAGALWQGSAAL
jgi:hypothetical protein